MATAPEITVKVKPDLSEVKDLLHEFLDVVEKHEQQDDETRQN